MKQISVVIPALNERDGIDKTIQAIPATRLQDMGYELQVVVVDNGSTDGTADLARKAGAEVIFEGERGYGRAHKAGFGKATGEIIATADADATYPLEQIPELVETLENENLDFITTNRYAYMEKGAMSALHWLGNAVLSIATRLLFRRDLKDSQSGMWVFRRALLDKMTLKYDGMAFSQELKIEACYYLKCRWKECPISYRSRVGNVKLRTWRDGFSNLYSLIEKKFVR